MNRILGNCPVCTGDLYVAEVACDDCGTRVSSRFEISPFCRLSEEQNEFLELFLRSRGNISGVGTELGMSYPTATKRLEAILATLGWSEVGEPVSLEPPKPDFRDEERKRILDLLDRGEITAEEAARRIHEL
jgi:hypothetical protein